MTDRRREYFWPKWAEVKQDAEAEMPEGVLFVMGVIFLGIVLAAFKYLWPGVIAVVVIYNLYRAFLKQNPASGQVIGEYPFFGVMIE
jgi:hypothetical protein